MPSLQGLTAYEIDRILDMAMSNNGTLDADDKEMILKQKKGMVKKSGLLELIDTPENIESIGGLDDLKNYLEEDIELLNYANRFKRLQVLKALNMPVSSKEELLSVLATEKFFIVIFSEFVIKNGFAMP